MQTEIWKDVIGYSGLYQVSNLGRVKCLERNGVKKGGNILSPSNNGYGYLKVVLCNKKKITKYVHILVAESFLGYKANKGIINVDHINEVKTDNRLENLQILSHRDNLIKSHHSNTDITNIYKVRNKYRVIVYSKHIGYFNTIENAIVKRDEYFNQLNNKL
jgi:hypothetical protein